MVEFDASGEDAPARSGAVAAAVACLEAGVERADPVRATREAVSVASSDGGDASDTGSDLVVDGERYALADGPALPDDAEVAVAAVDTDGRDGSTEAAGAVTGADALASTDARTAARDALFRNDATGFLEEYAQTAGDSTPAGGPLRSGATGTNVNDLRVVVVDDPER